jgi:hypothetical protein
MVIKFGRHISPPDIEAQLAPDNYLYTHPLKLGFVTQQQFDSWVHPEEMTHPLRGKP